MRAWAKKLFVETLESGEYWGGSSALCRAGSERWSAWGVLIDSTQIGDWELRPGGDTWSYDGFSFYLPPSVVHNVGLTVVEENLFYDWSRSCSFTEIAARVRAEF